MFYSYPISNPDFVNISPGFPCTFCRNQSKLTYLVDADLKEPDLSRENAFQFKIHNYEIVSGRQTNIFSIVRGKGVRLQV